MLTAEHYRAKAIEYAKLLKTAKNANETRKYQGLERSFHQLADNAQWLSGNQGSVILRA